MKTIKAFQCEFCRPGRGRAYISGGSCKAHEAKCHDNPATHSCATCQFKGSRDVHASAKARAEYPGCITTEYYCQAQKPGKCLTTNCPSWKIRPEQVDE